jgi:GMP synthase-like glutamine amidotransferase
LEIKRPLLYVVGGDHGYYRPWASVFAMADSPEEAQACLFTGGEDISPELYGEKNVASYPNPRRDAYEVQYFEYFKERKVPMIGICRGAQLICALNGGTLFQDVPNHVGEHVMVTEEGREYEVSSCHHQMLRPKGNYRVIAWSPEKLDYYTHEKGGKKHTIHENPQGKDPEVVYYNDLRALCIQGHPEFMPTNHITNDYFRLLARQLLL